MAEADIFQVIEDYRQEVNRNELTTLRQLTRLWVPSYNYLKQMVADLTATIQAQKDKGEPVWIGYVHSQDRYKRMMDQTQHMIWQYNRAAAGQINGAEAEAVDLGTKRGRSLVNIVEPDDPMWTRVNKRETRITAGMLSEQSPLSELLSKSWPETKSGIEQALITGISTGQGSAWIAEQMMLAVAIPLQRALLIARTEVNRVYRQANLEAMRESRAVLGYRRMCYPPTACFACLMMDGEYYDKDEAFSDHPNGKCSAVPVTRHFDPANDKNWERGQDWFARQDEATQRKLMGPGRFDLWKQQGVNPRDMVWIKPNKVWGGSPAVKTFEMLGFQRPTTNVNSIGVQLLHKAGVQERPFKPISRKRIDQLTIEIRKKGAFVEEATDEILQHLLEENATAVTIGDIIFYRPDICLSEMLEEIRHVYQNEIGMNNDEYPAVHELLNEIEAREWVIQNAKKYQVPRIEIEEFESQIEGMKEKLRIIGKL